MNMIAFEKFAKHLNEVVAGKRGFVSLTHHAKACETKREKLEVIADMAGLRINRLGGSYGICAMREK
jgi:hypothetical protein